MRKYTVLLDDEDGASMDIEADSTSHDGNVVYFYGVIDESEATEVVAMFRLSAIKGWAVVLDGS